MRTAENARRVISKYEFVVIQDIEAIYRGDWGGDCCGYKIDERFYVGVAVLVVVKLIVMEDEMVEMLGAVYWCSKCGQ